MVHEIKHPPANDRPLVGDVEAPGDPLAGRRHDREERDGSIIRLLKGRLVGREPSHAEATPVPRRRRTDVREDEDKYEPQRLNRKICWQYDSSAHKVPLIRRPYI